MIIKHVKVLEIVLPFIINAHTITVFMEIPINQVEYVSSMLKNR